MSLPGYELAAALKAQRKLAALLQPVTKPVTTEAIVVTREVVTVHEIGKPKRDRAAYMPSYRASKKEGQCSLKP